MSTAQKDKHDATQMTALERLKARAAEKAALKAKLLALDNEEAKADAAAALPEIRKTMDDLLQEYDFTIQAVYADVFKAAHSLTVRDMLSSNQGITPPTNASGPVVRPPKVKGTTGARVQLVYPYLKAGGPGKDGHKGYTKGWMGPDAKQIGKPNTWLVFKDAEKTIVDIDACVVASTPADIAWMEAKRKQDMEKAASKAASVGVALPEPDADE